MYSSVYSNEYSQVYYDYLKTPVQINNRLAILTANNPFLLNFMGVRYLETSRPMCLRATGCSGKTTKPQFRKIRLYCRQPI